MMNISDSVITSLPHVSLHPPSSPPLPTCSSFPRHMPNDDLSDATPSSDPVFSDDMSVSDDQPQTSSSRKRGTIRAPWFNLPSSNPPKRSKRELSRYVDSGVWLASESSDNVGDDTLVADDTIMGDDSFSPSPSKRARSGDPSHDVAARKIRDCIDQCRELVDLSDLGLGSVPSELLNPLHQFIRSRHLDVPMASPLATLTPGLGLYLSNNSIREVGPGLWNLQNVEVLSLRNNELTELSEHIGRLARLKELNIAGNQIQALPWALLELIKSHPPGEFKLSARPNPLFDPIDPDYLAASYSVDLRAPEEVAVDDSSLDANALTLSVMLQTVCKTVCEHARARSEKPPSAVYGGCSAMRFYNSHGLREPKWQKWSRKTHWARVIDDESGESTVIEPESTVGVPSLFELASRCCARAPYLGDMDAWRQQGVSPAVDQALTRATAVRAAGGMPHCSVCDKEYLVHRAEWVEYWCCPTSFNAHPSDMFLPFLRRACSLACALQGNRLAVSAGGRTSED